MNKLLGKQSQNTIVVKTVADEFATCPACSVLVPWTAPGGQILIQDVGLAQARYTKKVLQRLMESKNILRQGSKAASTAIVIKFWLNSLMSKLSPHGTGPASGNRGQKRSP